MSDRIPPVTLDALLEHRSWVRALARRLVVDENAVDDLEQETWISALRRPPRPGTSPRAWLGTVLRNWVRRGYRSEGRRGRYELAAAAADTPRPATALVARAEAHRSVVEAVLALPEPYRSVVLYRYFEGLSPARGSRRGRIRPWRP